MRKEPYYCEGAYAENVSQAVLLKEVFLSFSHLGQQQMFDRKKIHVIESTERL